MANFDGEDVRRTEFNSPGARAAANTPMLIGAALVIVLLIGSVWYSFRGADMSAQGPPHQTTTERPAAPPASPQPAPPKPKKLGPFKRWLQARRERKAQREAEQKAADEARMDDLLDKIHRQGKDSLTDEERHFMARVSARYRNRS